MRTPLILLAEDDVELNRLVTDRLTSSGYDVHATYDGREALESASAAVPDVVLLDIMLPEVDGLEVCRRLRAEHPLLHIIMLTARADEIDRVVGLEVGADDYMTKPFSLQELVARVRAAVRRIRLVEEQSRQVDEEELLRFGVMEIDPVRREVRVADETLYLTAREFDLLLFLARSPNRPFTRLQLLENVWGIQYEGYERTVDSHIQRLRSKIEPDASNPTFIRTVWGVGYKLHEDEEAARP